LTLIFLNTNKLPNNTLIPNMNKPMVGVKLPVSGVDFGLELADWEATGVVDAFVVAGGEAEFIGVADGVDTKAGPSAA
jgi:hypothetical protein